MAHFVLLYTHPELGEQRFELEANRSYRIGSRSDNDVVIPQKDVSRHHAILRTFDGTFQITDLNSKNGTFVNGARSDAADFRCGDQLNISSARVVVLELSTGALSLVRDERPTPKRVPRGGDSREDTVKHRIEATAEDIVSLLETTSAAVARGALADPLKWAVDNLGLDGAVVLYRDPRDNVAMVTSAGDLGPLILDSSTLNRLVREQETFDGPSVREVREREERLLVAPLLRQHTLVVRYSGDPPAVGDVRALMAAQEAVLGAVHGEHEDGCRSKSVLTAAGQAVLGGSRAIEACRDLCASFARRDEPVLLIGEPGSGRRHLAAVIHQESDRAERPMLVVDCSTLPPDLLETEILGAAPDAARGTTGTEGAVAAAEGGTVCLHNVDAIATALQPAIRQLVKDGVAHRGGDSAPRPADIRIIATTSVDLDHASRLGRFDAELLSRLGTLRLAVPPLRERREDIPVLANRFLLRNARRADKSILGIAVQAMEALVAHEWPDNIRELELEMERVVGVTRAGGMVELSHLKPDVVACGPSPTTLPPEIEELAESPLDVARAAFERWMVERVLSECDGNQTRTAARLGLSRAGLFKKMKRLGI